VEIISKAMLILLEKRGFSWFERSDEDYACSMVTDVGDRVDAVVMKDSVRFVFKGRNGVSLDLHYGDPDLFAKVESAFFL